MTRFVGLSACRSQPRTSARDRHSEPALLRTNARLPRRVRTTRRGDSGTHHGKLRRAPLRLRAIQRCGTGGATAPAPRPPASPGERAGSPREGSTAPRFIDFPHDGIDWFPGNIFRKKSAGRAGNCRPPVAHRTPTCHHSNAYVDSHVSLT